MTAKTALEKLKNAHIITALITPFLDNGEINFDAYEPLIEKLLAENTQGFVLAGTTAESPTLTHDEELAIFKKVNEIAAGRVPLIAGVGTNDTRDSINFVKEVAELGYIDAGLAVVPYYNKPSQEGLYQHFKAIAESSDLPIMLYNIPGRTVAQLELPTILRLTELENIIAIKDCRTLEDLTELIDAVPEDFLVYTGEDGFAFHSHILGAQGVISVASHVLGKELLELIITSDQGDRLGAAKKQATYLKKVNALFSISSPAPVKAVLNHQGYQAGGLRLPLVAATDAEARAIIEIVEKK